MDLSELKNCNLCPRKCGVNRLDINSGSKGFCNAAGETIRIGRAALHYYEEPCISGESGSGAVFFSGCSLRCDFCQNSSLSREFSGADVDISRLAEIFFELKEKGANNINLITPTHYTTQIREAIKISRRKGFDLPFVWNSSGYELSRTLRTLDGLIDIWLPDFKYLSSETAGKYSKAKDYPEYAKSAIKEMVRQCPTPEFSYNGIMKKGVIIRHLLLPGQLEQSKRVIEYLHKEYGNSIYLSIMSQYTPQESSTLEELKNPVPYSEYEELVDFAMLIGVENGFIQEEGSADDSFIPVFNGEGVI